MIDRRLGGRGRRIPPERQPAAGRTLERTNERGPLGWPADKPDPDLMRRRTTKRQAVSGAEQCRHNDGYPDDR
jgi:hypothetical protein